MAEWHDPEAERQFYKDTKREELKLAILRIVAGTFVLVVGPALIIVGAAVIKWALEELAK